MKILHSADHIAEFAYAGALNHHSIRVKLCPHLLKRLAKVAHQATADAAGIHLRDFHACILQKAAVNGDLAKFILNQHKLLAVKSLGN